MVQRNKQATYGPSVQPPKPAEAGNSRPGTATRPITALKAMVGQPGRAVSIEDMNAAIARRGASAR